MASRFLTTGQAANRCSVTSDTVLKWIRSGRLPARRTAGGHHRIDERDLSLVLRPSVERVPAGGRHGRIQYCWEFNGNGTLLDGCRDCVVYRLKAQRCYEVARLAEVEGHSGLFCRESCDRCEYYARVRGQATNVLVVTDDAALVASLREGAGGAPFNLEIADCEYACSAAVDRFRPDFAVVDCSLGREAAEDICHHLAADPRIPFARVIVAASAGELSQLCETDVFARIERPFDIRHITACIAGCEEPRDDETRRPMGLAAAIGGPGPGRNGTRRTRCPVNGTREGERSTVRQS